MLVSDAPKPKKRGSLYQPDLPHGADLVTPWELLGEPDEEPVPQPVTLPPRQSDATLSTIRGRRAETMTLVGGIGPRPKAENRRRRGKQSAPRVTARLQHNPIVNLPKQGSLRLPNGTQGVLLALRCDGKFVSSADKVRDISSASLQLILLAIYTKENREELLCSEAFQMKNIDVPSLEARQLLDILRDLTIEIGLIEIPPTKDDLWFCYNYKMPR